MAANGDNIAIYLGGQPTLVGGTSASSPIFASLVTRINEERIKAGKGRHVVLVFLLFLLN